MATTAEDWTYIKTLTAITADGDIPIDINAATIGNLEVDIAASTIGNLPIDLTAQSGSDVNIDISTQTIGRLVIRDHDGGAESTAMNSTTVNSGTGTNILNYSGTGSFRWFYWKVSATAHSHYISARLIIDDTTITPYFMFEDLNALGFNTSTRPIQLLKYGVGGVCVAMLSVEKPIVFDTSLKVYLYNHSAAHNISVNYAWFYQMIS